MKVGYVDKFRRFAIAVENINTTKIFLRSAQEQSELALNLNRLQLQAEHITSDNKKLGVYAKSNKKQGERDLYLTGAFQERMFLDTKKIPIFIGSKDEKAPILTKIYGVILGLTKQNQTDYKSEVLKVYKEKINHEIEVLANKILS